MITMGVALISFILLLLMLLNAVIYRDISFQVFPQATVTLQLFSRDFLTALMLIDIASVRPL